MYAFRKENRAASKEKREEIVGLHKNQRYEKKTKCLPALGEETVAAGSRSIPF